MTPRNTPVNAFLESGFRIRALIAASVLVVAPTASCHHLSTSGVPQNDAVKTQPNSFTDDITGNADAMLKEGRKVFRHETFGDEYFWGDTLQLQRAIAGERHGGVGPGLTPRKALELGLKVDVDHLNRILGSALRGGSASLDEVQTTLELLKADAVVGVKAFYDDGGLRPSRIGITCALCHSTVNDALTKGIGNRLDGWPNRDLNVGAVVAMAPRLTPFEQALQLDAETIRKVLRSWGPGKYDARSEERRVGKEWRSRGRW